MRTLALTMFDSHTNCEQRKHTLTQRRLPPKRQQRSEPAWLIIILVDILLQLIRYYANKIIHYFHAWRWTTNN